MRAGELTRGLDPSGAPSHRTPVVALIALFFLLMLPNLDNSYPYQGDETFYTVSAMNMIDRAEYLAPFYAGEYRFNKPILTYWVAVSAYKLFGASMWSARVPILLLACLTIFTTYRLALWTLRDSRKALLAAAMLASSPMFFGFSRVAMTEMVLISCTIPAVFMFARMLEDPEHVKRYAALGTALIGLAFMVKGPAGLLPYGAALIQSAMPGRPGKKRLLFALVNPLNLAIFAAITVPWYAYVATNYPAAFAGDLGAESQSLWEHSVAGTGKRLLSYAWALAIFTFPFFLAGAALMVKTRTRWSPACSFIATCILTHLLTFTLFVGVYKSRYLLPVIPLLSIVLADALFPSGWRRWLTTAGVVLALQAVFYALSPIVSHEPLRELTHQWRDGHSASGTLGTALDPKRAGWCRLYAGNRGMAPPESAGFVIIEDADLPRYEGWGIIGTATRNSSLKISQGSISVTKQTFHLVRRPEGGPPGSARLPIARPISPDAS
jgi:4-amino-4-deoxy-L-arabinose transferase-like glycosyltransferase